MIDLITFALGATQMILALVVILAIPVVCWITFKTVREELKRERPN